MLKDPAVRNLFNTTFAFGPLQTSARIAAPPTDDSRQSVGTAFDYLARFWLKRRHPDAEVHPWNAIFGAVMLGERAAADPQRFGLAQAARESLASAVSEYKAYADTGDPTDGLLRAALGLADLDVVYRAGVTAGVGVEPQPGDMADLRGLWKVMESGDLRSLGDPVHLNPNFGDASALVHGADADVMADGILVEIKTDRKPTFNQRHFRQLAGYATLQRLAGRPDFRKIGVYLARYGKLLTADADVIYGAPAFGEFLEEFQRHAEGMFGPRERRTGAPGQGQAPTQAV